MSIHVAILKRPYLRAILDGTKTIESRLYRYPQPPHGCIVPGERMFLKVSAGPWMATAVAAKVDTFDGLTPAGIDAMRREFGHAIGGDDAYWSWKRPSTCATLVHLAEVEPLDVGPLYAKTQRAWHVLDERLSPLHEVEITPGALRNRYAVFPKSECFDAPGVKLILPDGERIATSVASGRRLRWRGWGGFYESHEAQPGDRMRFVALGDATYRVSFRGGSACPVRKRLDRLIDRFRSGSGPAITRSRSR